MAPPPLPPLIAREPNLQGNGCSRCSTAGGARTSQRCAGRSDALALRQSTSRSRLAAARGPCHPQHFWLARRSVVGCGGRDQSIRTASWLERLWEAVVRTARSAVSNHEARWASPRRMLNKQTGGRAGKTPSLGWRGRTADMTSFVSD
jgi:hypothetical protein